MEELIEAGRAARSAEAQAELVDRSLGLIPRAIRVEDHASAGRLLQLAGSAAQGSKQKHLQAWVQAAEREVRYWKSELEQVKLARETLLTKPQDPRSNLVVGRYLCLARGDLEGALGHLARAPESALRAAVAEELAPAPPSTPGEQAAQGNRWLAAASEWNAVAREAGTLAYRWHFLAREFQAKAARWYELAAGRLSGTARVEVGEKAVKLTSTTRSQAIGGKEGGGFTDAPSGPALLIGFRYCSSLASPYEGSPIIEGLQPIYLTPEGKTSGTFRGSSRAPKEVLARPGYAVGGITAKGGSRLIGFRIAFFRVSGAGLDPKDSYLSEWFGGKGGRPETKLGGDGKPVVGVHGRSGDHIDSLGLIQRS